MRNIKKNNSKMFMRSWTYTNKPVKYQLEILSVKF